MERKKKIIFWGLALMLAGALLLARNLNVLPIGFPMLIFKWTTILLVIGIYWLFVKLQWGGMIPISIALYFMAPDIFGIELVPLKELWPVVLIFIGVGVLLKVNSPGFKKKDFYTKKDKYKFSLTDDYMEAIAVFGGGNKKVSSYNFQGGSIVAVFGGLEIDLTNCTLAKEKAEIEIAAVFGGVSLHVPKEWNIQSDIVPIMGGMSDNIGDFEDAYVDPAATLVIKGTCVFGGIEIQRI
jgi:predicted membrane protein